MNHEFQYPVNVQLHELTRGIFDAAMRVYLNRFLNIPPTPITDSNSNSGTVNNIEKHNAMEEELSMILDKIVLYIFHNWLDMGLKIMSNMVQCIPPLYGAIAFNINSLTIQTPIFMKIKRFIEEKSF